MDCKQLVQDVHEGKESSLIAYAILNDKMQEIYECMQEVLPIANHHMAGRTEKTITSGSRTFKFKRYGKVINYERV